jgi:hypothetical protein
MLIWLRNTNWRRCSAYAILALHRRHQVTPELTPMRRRIWKLQHPSSTRSLAVKDLVGESRDGGTGRRSGLKIRRPSGLGGSTPPPGTKLKIPSREIFRLDIFRSTSFPSRSLGGSFRAGCFHKSLVHKHMDHCSAFVAVTLIRFCSRCLCGSSFGRVFGPALVSGAASRLVSGNRSDA